MFKAATKTKAKLKLALAGATGSGKTFSSLILARKLAGPNGKVALIDSERGSASLYADRFKFDVCDLLDHSIATYEKAIRAAAAAGYDVLVVDSMSHEWMGKGGALETVDRMGGNKFTDGWRTVSPQHTAFLDAVLSYPGHVVATLRKKMEYVIVDNAKGKKEPQKVGLAPVQRDGVEYEFSVVLDMEIGGTLTVAKTRCAALEEMKGSLRREDIEKVGDVLLAWLNDGAEAPPAPAPKPTPGNGAPDPYVVRINEAQSREQLTAVAEELKAHPERRAALRDLFNKRLAELSKGAAA